MFTPHKSSRSGCSLSARKTGAVSVSVSGKVHNSSPTDGEQRSIVPPLGLTEMTLDADRLPDRNSLLEKELFEYQYNMGLLLIEKKELISKYEQLKQAVAETTDALKREQTAHLIAMTDVEKREDELRRALGVEKQCVSELEKALRGMRSEYAEIKFTADSKLDEANALVASIHEKSLELEMKSHSADAKLAEISRKSSEIERKLQDVEAREAALRRERLSFISVKESHDTTFSKQRVDLQEWESKLREAEERVGDRQRILNQREEKSNEKDKMCRQKQKELEELQRMMDEANVTLKRKENDISNRLSELALKEREYEPLQKKLEMKENELRVFEEQLKAREKEELEKMLDDHNRMLEVKKHEFELECDQKRKSLDVELARRRSELQKKEEDTTHREEKIVKKEQAMEKKSEKLKEKEGDIQSKLKDLKEREKLLRSEENNLEAEKKQLMSEKEELVTLKTGLEKIRADNEELLLRISEEMEQLKVTEEEKVEYLRLQSELRQEIEKCREQKEVILKEAEDLKQQKEMFEKEWEELDDKRAEIEKGVKDLCQEKEKFEKLMRSEEEKLKKEKLSSEEYLRREKEELELQKQLFSASMEQEKLVLCEENENERSQMQRDFELRKKELERNMQSKLDELENDLQKKYKSFEEEKERELSNISYLRELARREMDELKQERQVIGRERQEFVVNKKHLEEQQIEIGRDIDQLTDLNRKLKEQREKLAVERESFISFVEKQQSCCNNCHELTREFVLFDLQRPSEIDNVELPQSKFARDYGEKELSEIREVSDRQNNNDASPQAVKLGSPVSWIIQKCKTKIFNFSAASKKLEQHSTAGEEEAVDGDHFENGGVELSFDAINVQGNVNSEMVEDSDASELKVTVVNGRRGTRKVKSKSVVGNEQQNGNAQSRDESSLLLNENGQTNKGRMKRNRDQTSVSQHDAVDVYDDDDGNSENVSVGHRLKRRQKSGAVVNVEPRYNLRRPQTSKSTVGASKVSSQQNEEKKQDCDRVCAGEINYINAAPSVSVSVASGSRHFARSGWDGEDQEATKEKHNIGGMALSEEVNGTPERVVRDEEEEDEFEYEHPGEVSIGKRLFKFLTT